MHFLCCHPLPGPVELSRLPWLEAHHQNQISAENRAVRGCLAVWRQLRAGGKAAVTALKGLVTVVLTLACL